MKESKGRWKVCSRGHKFYKTSDCPICPTCWSGHYKKRYMSDFPERLSAPALRALLNAEITNLEQLTKYKESEILKLHGMGPSGVKMLANALKVKGLAFKR